MSSAAEVPLTERLRSVPSTARFQQDFADGIGTNYWGVGSMCHEAAAEISRLTAELEEARKDAGRWNLIRSVESGTIRLDRKDSLVPQYIYWSPGGSLDSNFDAAVTKEKS